MYRDVAFAGAKYRQHAQCPPHSTAAIRSCREHGRIIPLPERASDIEKSLIQITERIGASATSRSRPRNHVFFERLSRIREISEHFGRVSSRLRRTARTLTVVTTCSRPGLRTGVDDSLSARRPE